MAVQSGLARHIRYARRNHAVVRTLALGGTATMCAPEGSVEEQLHRLGYAYAFLDLRAARGEAKHPLGGPQTMRVPKYENIEITDATRPYDAIFYIARMEPATLIR